MNLSCSISTWWEPLANIYGERPQGAYRSEDVRLLQAVSANQKPADQIKAHVEPERCGCEINNRKGLAVLGMIRGTIVTAAV